jgi:hypothetical protein
MRQLIATVLMVLAFAGSAMAYDDPKALVEAIYLPYQSGQKQADPNQFYSARLKQLYAQSLARHAEAAADGGAGQPPGPQPHDLLSFDPFIEGQNALINDLTIGEPLVLGDRATVSVSFHNFDHASLMSLSLVQEPDGWKVDDVAALGGSQNWLLSWLLQYDPFSEN